MIKCRKESRKHKKYEVKEESRKLQAKIKKCFTTIEMEKEIENVLTYHGGTCRPNITNKKWHAKKLNCSTKTIWFSIV